MTTYRFQTDCVNSDDGAGIQAMVDAAHEISRRTFLGYVDRAQLREIEAACGYESHPKRGLTMANDWSVSYHRSTFRGRPCVYFRWSAIEHIFTPDGTGAPVETYAARRHRRSR